jgi:osmoprotectant transport system substrate-binding protein
MPELRGLVCAAGLALAIACAACTTATSQVLPDAARPAGAGRAVITVGSFDFPESVLLAYLYADALAAQGYPVRVMPDLGSRELVDPALMTGLIQLVPEYAGSALQFVSLGRVPATASVAATAAALTRSMAARGIITGRPAAAQDANAVVVTAATAARYQLHSTSDLARVAPRLVFGGPPECPERPYCLPGLRLVYGLRFRAFIPLDAGGALTRQALESGDISAALLFTTDPIIQARHLVVLTDDRGLQPAENIVPVLGRETAARYGPALVATLDAVSARLSTAALASLDAQVELGGRAARTVADIWLRARGLLVPGRGHHER